MSEQAKSAQVVSRAVWLEARKALLAEERAATHQRDRVNAQRRALPWVAVEKDYRFLSPTGPLGLADLFQGKSQLFVQHLMFPPGGPLCPGCAGLSDLVDASRQHFQEADLAFAAVSRAPVVEIEAAKRRMGWRFLWVSAGDSGFNHDYGTAFTPEQVASGETGYNYGTTPYAHDDLPGVSVFNRGADGRIFHSYSAYTRGTETLFAPFAFLDMTPKGRNEGEGTMSWLRLHDEYGAEAAPGCCSAAE